MALKTNFPLGKSCVTVAKWKNHKKAQKQMLKKLKFFNDSYKKVFSLTKKHKLMLNKI